jgi:hypothetical protein
MCSSTDAFAEEKADARKSTGLVVKAFTYNLYIGMVFVFRDVKQ